MHFDRNLLGALASKWRWWLVVLAALVFVAARWVPDAVMNSTAFAEIRTDGFVPARLTQPAGATIAIRNTTDQDCDLENDGGVTAPVVVQPGGIARVVLPASGRYSFHCGTAENPLIVEAVAAADPRDRLPWPFPTPTR